MKLWRSMLAELIERASTHVIAALLDDSSDERRARAAYDKMPVDDDEPQAANGSVDLLTHDEVQQMLVEREAMRARHPVTEPAPPPDEEPEAVVGSLQWRARQSDVRRIK